MWKAVGWSQKIEGRGRLVDEAIPEVEGEVGVDARETGNEVVFSRADRLLSRVGSVFVRRDELEVYFFELHERSESRGAFVVQKLNGWGQAAVNEGVIDGGERPRQFFVLTALHAFREDAICIMDVTRHDVFGTFAGRFGETAHLVGGYFSGYL